jgi:hypothetical protein
MTEINSSRKHASVDTVVSTLDKRSPQHIYISSLHEQCSSIKCSKLSCPSTIFLKFIPFPNSVKLKFHNFPQQIEHM